MAVYSDLSLRHIPAIYKRQYHHIPLVISYGHELMRAVHRYYGPLKLNFIFEPFGNWYASHFVVFLGQVE